jgi:hypothetical protein
VLLADLATAEIEKGRISAKDNGIMPLTKQGIDPS